MHSSDAFSDLGFRVATLSAHPVSVEPEGAGAGLKFAFAGPHPVRGEARFLVVLPRAGHVRIEVFDVAGRRVGGTIDDALPAGAHVVRSRTEGLPSGVYVARLTALGRSEVIRFVRIR
jgi:hypothetical protein